MIITTLQYKQSLPNNRTIAQSPQGPREPPKYSLLRLRETPYTTLLVFPALYPTSRPLSYPARAGIPNYEEGANTPSRAHPETPASPTRVSTMVTGTLHTRFSVNLSKCRTLPDSANLPPGLYCSADEAYGQTHFFPNYPPPITHTSSYTIFITILNVGITQ